MRRAEDRDKGGPGLPVRDYAFARMEERLVSYADKLAGTLEAGLAESLTAARARLPEILAANPNTPRTRPRLPAMLRVGG